MRGKWIFVCGPSGVGKDSLIAWSRSALAGHPNMVFARRLVTRIAQPGTDDDTVNESAFLSLRQSGGLRWHWQAHGFCYGISQSYADQVGAGGLVVINGSRSHVDGLPASPDIKRVEITASPDNIAARLALRGRDAQEDVIRRLARNAEFEQSRPSNADLLISNDADIAIAGTALVNYLAAQAGVNAALARPINSA
jgi:ribose 1,5-bisphosphokinase